MNTRHLSIVAGVGFIAIGTWTLWGALRGALIGAGSRSGNPGVMQPPRRPVQMRGEPTRNGAHARRAPRSPSRSPN
ncbi:MAG: hypothetical protein MZV70_42985 [Desulfobacterales bacterium]|nr:hypothetical protein [Desulfobacterales bacterium]